MLHNNQLKLDKQSGISLMLSVLVLAAITAISFSITTIVFIELKSSSDVVKSEPSLYATLGVTEEALFQYKRYVNDREDGSTETLLDVPSCTTSTGDQNVCKLAGTNISLPPQDDNSPQPFEFDDPVRIESIDAGVTKVIPLYTLNNYDLLYNTILLKRVPTDNTGNLNVKLRLISEDPSVPDEFLPSEEGQNLAENDTLPVNWFTYSSGYEYELFLTNTSNGNIQLSISSFGTDDHPKGLPFIGKKVLKVLAEYAGLNRTYKVFIPVP